MRRQLSYHIILILGFTFFCGCSAERNNVISRGFHNTTARFNPYFIANEHIKEVENTLESQHQRNYNKILKVYPDIDSTTINSMRPQLEDAIKKTSKAIDWHKNSNMVDPSYILLGRSLYYLGEFEKSITAYKIVNKNTVQEKDKRSRDVRHEALIHLMRTYIDYNEESNAIAVSDFLRKEDLSKSNRKLLYLNRSYLFQRRKELDSMVNNLAKAAPLMKKNEGKSKIYFMVGQVYQDLGFDALAYNNYTSCIKSNPDYELSFYAKLNRAQVFELSKTTDVKKIRKFYKKLLKDAKNEEFRDKIYYDMGEFEFKQNDLEKAISYYNLSVRSSINNNRQKAYSYLRLGQIYYEQKKSFELAKLYYDSTIQVMPKDEERYEAIEQRQQVLANFVEQLHTIKLQDSLLTLADMDSISLNKYLDEIIIAEEEEAALKKLEEEKKKSKSSRKFSDDFGERNNAFTASATASNEGATWYFYNPSAIGQGQNEFVRRWGNRALEDNWRRQSKENVITSEIGVAPDGEVTSDAAVEETVDPVELRSRRKAQFLATIPFAPDEKTAAHKMLEDAYYILGNIYNFDLVEKENALNTFDTLLVKYPQTEYKAEVLYQIYLIYRNQENQRADIYKDQLLNQFPNSIYARIIKNPNYQEESNAASEQLKIAYKEAFTKYEEGDYEGATEVINRSTEGKTVNDFSDNMRLLEILIMGKTDDVYRYQMALTEFPNQFPESELNDYVSQLMKTSRDHLDMLASGVTHKYIEDFEQPHSFVLVYNFEAYGEEELPKRIEEFIKNYFPESKLNVAQLILTGSKSLILVNEFRTSMEALTFFNLFNGDISPLKGLNLLDFNNFVITKDNFDIFYQTKDIDNYMTFFDQHYN